jgi:hypothetical protein
LRLGWTSSRKRGSGNETLGIDGRPRPTAYSERPENIWNRLMANQ